MSVGHSSCVKRAAHRDTHNTILWGMQLNPILMRYINYEWYIWYFPLHAVWANTIIQYNSFYSVLHCNHFFPTFRTLKCTPVSRSIALHLSVRLVYSEYGEYNKHELLYISLPVLCSLLPLIPEHHMLPWVLICHYLSSSHWKFKAAHQGQVQYEF